MAGSRKTPANDNTNWAEEAGRAPWLSPTYGERSWPKTILILLTMLPGLIVFAFGAAGLDIIRVLGLR